MNSLANKSAINALSAKLLIEKGLYPSSVHCSYYSVFQLMFHKLSTLKKISIEELNQEIASDRKKNTHVYVLNEFCVHLRSHFKGKINPREIQELKREVKDLKQFRVESDYHNVEVDTIKSEQALSISSSLLKTINSIR